MKRLAVMVFILVIAAWVTGCSGSNNAGDEPDSMTIKMDNGKTLEISNSEWPANFPEDVPRPKEIQVTASLQNDTGSTTVSIETKMPFGDLVTLYKNYAANVGYSEAIEINDEGYYMYSGTRGDEVFMFTFSLDQEDRKTVTGAISHEIKA